MTILKKIIFHLLCFAVAYLCPLAEYSTFGRIHSTITPIVNKNIFYKEIADYQSNILGNRGQFPEEEAYNEEDEYEYYYDEDEAQTSSNFDMSLMDSPKITASVPLLPTLNNMKDWKDEDESNVDHNQNSSRRLLKLPLVDLNYKKVSALSARGLQKISTSVSTVSTNLPLAKARLSRFNINQAQNNICISNPDLLSKKKKKK